MTAYQHLHWASLNFVKNHLYRRLATPLNVALGRIAIARHEGSLETTREQLAAVEQSLEIALNLIKAWSTLIHVQSGGMIPDSARRTISRSSLPGWLLDSLRKPIEPQITFNHTLHVHVETFYESLLILAHLTGEFGIPRAFLIEDGFGSQVAIRAVFSPPDSGRYGSLTSLVSSLDMSDPRQADAAIQIHVLGSMLRINGARFVLQNNTQSGEQALAALLPAATSPLNGHDSHEAGHEPADQPPQETTAPILAGPVLAPTPRETSPVGSTDYLVAPNPLSGPVLAPTPRAFSVPTGRTAPLKDSSGEKSE